LSPEVLRAAQALLDEGLSVPQIAERLGVLATTLHKAIDDGRLRGPREQKKSTAKPAVRQQPDARRPRANAG
jgi:transposase-like protein